MLKGFLWGGKPGLQLLFRLSLGFSVRDWDKTPGPGASRATDFTASHWQTANVPVLLPEDNIIGEQQRCHCNVA